MTSNQTARTFRGHLVFPYTLHSHSIYSFPLPAAHTFFPFLDSFTFSCHPSNLHFYLPPDLGKPGWITWCPSRPGQAQLDSGCWCQTSPPGLVVWLEILWWYPIGLSPVDLPSLGYMTGEEDMPISGAALTSKFTPALQLWLCFLQTMAWKVQQYGSCWSTSKMAIESSIGISFLKLQTSFLLYSGVLIPQCIIF